MKNLLIITAIISMLTGCVSIPDAHPDIAVSQPIEFNFNGSLYNSVATKYMERPTFGELNSDALGHPANMLTL